MTALDQFRGLVRELFQLDSAELDFGIYRILNLRRDEILRFLEDELPPEVAKAFEAYKTADKADIQKELDETIQKMKALGADPEASAKVKDLRAKLAGGIDVKALENEVFSDLYTFFSRYYSEGDFISQRRYKDNVYAIPYQGEEVKLHWANHDQYYIKTTEDFENYAFTLPSGKTVRFEVRTVKTGDDNNSTRIGNERRFFMAEKDPVAVNGDTLTVSFHFGSDKDKRKQSAINEDIFDRLLQEATIKTWSTELLAEAPTPKQPGRTLLEKHLGLFTAKNTFDYFIHKDLGGFLRRELDFFIKNEILHLDDLDNQTPDRVAQRLSKTKVLRDIATKLIDFIAQLEEFQKRLWLKRKLVIDGGYCLTLDRVPTEFLAEIAANEGQRKEWVKLFAINEALGYSEPLKPGFLANHRHLVLDTRHYDLAFTLKLLAKLPNLDDNLDGLLIRSENFQALQLIRPKYGGKVACINIDPPYNTKSGDFVYKDNYKHSSWLAMMADRLRLGQSLLREDGALFHHIDENEHARASTLLTEVFGADNRFGDIIWRNSSKNDEAYVSMQHEYILGAVKDASVNKGNWTERKEGLEEIYAAFDQFKKKHGTNWKAIHEEALKWYGSFPESNPIHDSKHYSWMDERGVYFPDNIAGPNFGQYRYEVLHPTTKKPCKEPASGWRFPPETMAQKVKEGLIHFGEDETTVPNNKTYLKNTEFQSLTSIKYKDGRVASRLLQNMFGEKVFGNPKDVDLTARVLKAVAPQDAIVLDYFAGSGTTAHSVIQLNRESGKRRYVLCEMGEYFDTILKPRILKAIYATEWKNGKPVSRDTGTSHAFRYLHLESYEDTLANLDLTRSTTQQTLLATNPALKQDYLIRYMLPTEAKASMTMMKTGAFEDPFNCRMKAQLNGGTATARVDLVETFNFLLGLHVQTIAETDGVRAVRGTDPNGQRVLVLWRNAKKTDNNALNKWFQTNGYVDGTQTFDVVYANGSNSLASLKPKNHTWTVRLTEEHFHRLMFEGGDV